MENKSIRDGVSSFMRYYRATPHSVTGVSPFKAMYNRRMKVGLPIGIEASDAIDRAKVEAAQAKMEESRKGAEHRLSRGDTVLVKQPKGNKLTPAYNPEPMTVTDVKGSMVTARSDDKSVTRDGSRFKKMKQIDDSAAVRPSKEGRCQGTVEGEVQSSDDSEAEESVNEGQPMGPAEPDIGTEDEHNNSGEGLRRSSRKARPPSYLKDYSC